MRPDGVATGAHYANSKNIVIDEGTIKFDPAGNGVFTARVEIRDSNGVLIEKGNSPLGKGVSTFFPRDWNSKRILDEISDAQKNPLPGQKDRYRTPSGIKVVIRYNEDGTIGQAFPDTPQ